MGNASAKKKGEGGRTCRYVRRLNEDIGMKAYFHGPMGSSKTLTLRFLVGDLNLPKRRKRCTSSRVEEAEGVQSCRCVNADERRTHTAVEECELYKEERNVSEEDMGRIDGCDMTKFGTLSTSEKTIAIVGGQMQMVATDGQRGRR